MAGRKSLISFLDAALARRSPGNAFLLGVGATVASHLLWQFLHDGMLLKRLNLLKNRVIRFLFAPIVQKKIDEAAREFNMKQLKGEVITEEIPRRGLGHERVIALAEQLHGSLDASYSEGFLSGTVYHGGKEHTAFINRIMEIYQWTNPLHLDVFNAVRKMEAEIVAMVVALFHGNTHRPDACGALTSGGTESISMAVKCYRDWGRAELGIVQPNIVMPITAHPAFDKACQYYGVRLIKVPVDSATGQVDPRVLESYITCDTVAIVGSAPNYPYGSVDPIGELSDIALSRGIGLHVDGCLGGFVVQFMEKAGIPNSPIVDFRHPGVTTISADTHKFGYAPKGTSTILYASKNLRRYQFFAIADWPGGIYCSPGASGSKAGNVIAGTWAALMAIGEDGYVEACRDIQRTKDLMVAGIESIPGLRILGRPQISAVAFTADDLDIFRLSEKLKKRGWKLNPLQFPSGIQFSLTLVHSRDTIMQRFVSDVRSCVDEMRADIAARRAKGEVVVANPSAKGGTMYGTQQSVDDRTILQDVAREFLNSYYKTRHVAVDA